jgi:hypothetical protein
MSFFVWFALLVLGVNAQQPSLGNGWGASWRACALISTAGCAVLACGL